MIGPRIRVPGASRPPLAWVLNLDAEHELETGSGYTPSEATRRSLASARSALAALLPSSDVVLDWSATHRDPDERARGLEGRCFCATRSALARLARAGAIVPVTPPEDIVRRVNERGFGYALGHLPGAARCTDEGEVRAMLVRGGRWLLKRGLGFAGRGQRRIDVPTEADLAWIRASLRRGALYVEPRVEIALEVAIHGMIEPSGAAELGVPTVQTVRDGAWRGSRTAAPGELARDEASALGAAGERVAKALFEAGYFGPFGVDAFRYRDGGERFQPLSEINARYTMAWGTGMGAFR